jgi:hypothetical protein
MSRFRHFMRGLPIETLPPRLMEAVCILTHGPEQWGAAFASFILAKQAGFDLAFQYPDQPLKPANLYLMPSVSGGGGGFSRRFWLDLDARVRAGATLYLSHHDAMLVPFNEPFGLEVQTRARRTGPVEFSVGRQGYRAESPVKLRLAPTRAQVLGREADGNPAMTRAECGQGEMIYLSVPIEHYVSNTPGSFHGAGAQPFWKIYEQLARPFMRGRAVSKDLPQVGLTEHPLDERRRAVIAINYSPEPVDVTLTLAEGWAWADAWYGAQPEQAGSSWRSHIAANDAAMFLVLK